MAPVSAWRRRARQACYRPVSRARILAPGAKHPMPDWLAKAYHSELAQTHQDMAHSLGPLIQPTNESTRGDKHI